TRFLVTLTLSSKVQRGYHELQSGAREMLVAYKEHSTRRQKLQDTEQLYRDIQMYLTLEKIEQNVDFWKSMLIVCNDKLEFASHS
ncbi:hypothetical protein CF335_g8894, partial [Tilletia laevis]